MFPKYGVPVDGTGGLQNWTTIDFLRSLVIIAMFVVAMLVEPCARICFWLRADSIASAVLGFCCYFFPSTILDHIVSNNITYNFNLLILFLWPMSINWFTNASSFAWRCRRRTRRCCYGRLALPLALSSHDHCLAWALSLAYGIDYRQ